MHHGHFIKRQFISRRRDSACAAFSCNILFWHLNTERCPEQPDSNCWPLCDHYYPAWAPSTATAPMPSWKSYTRQLLWLLLPRFLSVLLFSLSVLALCPFPRPPSNRNVLDCNSNVINTCGMANKRVKSYIPFRKLGLFMLLLKRFIGWLPS